jgi:MSHA pilin protein MshD
MFIKCRHAGISMIELLMFIIIVSVGIVGILTVTRYTTSHSADPLVRKQALAIAESLLEEIELSEFSDPGFGTCNLCANRALFDDVRDYNGYTSTGIFTVDGTAVTGLGSYNILPAVQVTAVNTNELGSVPAGGGWKITVHVTDPTGQVTTLTGYRTAYL